ncbi:hypothetical protein F5884DRAFT_847191 [Xylogone sp. PMI_703]|nr:hypothetical protein F5884DRAFT_847191 [Xylogone sp. PMI_703]
MPDPNDYTVGWICALTTEYIAAQVFLDEEQEGGPDFLPRNDNNDYTLGKIGGHNVVIAVLPDGEYGISSAAAVARDMVHSFPNIRIGMMVGIGGGAPNEKHDIRLGDVVVSAPRDGNGGVFQYDFGKTIQSQKFQYTKFLDQPPPVLRSAVSGIQAKYKKDGHKLEESINTVLEKYPRLQKEFQRPDKTSDKLFKATAIHDQTCSVVCIDDSSKLRVRLERTKLEDNLAIHYGLIASANQLMKDALIRDKLAAENDVLCFEMEAAGLMNHFPCLVIRGICDYSDTHKNKEWQGYAAMTAAAYAKDVLLRIAPRRVENEKKISSVLTGLQYTIREQRDIAREQLKIQEQTFKQRLSDKQQECLQLFRLTNSSKDITYEWYKDRVEDRVDGTCEWFLNHENFKRWLEQDSGPMLVSADPGCGKSVLAKYLIDHELPRSATIYQNTVRQALCALLHQLFARKPSLIEYAMELYKKEGSSLINSTTSLWAILGNALQDPQTEHVIIVLDALDECAESEFDGLVRNIKNQFQSNQSQHNRFKYLLTSRPYDQIVSKFQHSSDTFQYIRIPGEDLSENISLEVSRVIQVRVEQLARKKGLSEQIYLVFDYFDAEGFKNTLKGIDSAIATLPKTVNQAYEQILNKSKEHPMVRKTLSIILAATRPLTLLEMNIAVNIDDTVQSIYDIDLEKEEDFKLRLRYWCGLFVSVHHGKIYFFHQTAREFLLLDTQLPQTVPSEMYWHHSITIFQAHTILTKLCVGYLDLFNSDDGLPKDANKQAHHCIDSATFLDYSARNWTLHFREAYINDDDATVSVALRISDVNSRSYSVWSGIYWKQYAFAKYAFSTNIGLSSYFGHEALVKVLLKRGADIESKDFDGKTPLLRAAIEGDKTVVELLLKNGANIESKDSSGKTPLSWAVTWGYETIVELLLKNGADIESKDSDVEILLKNGANIESKDSSGKTPLSRAAIKGHEMVVELLLKNGANIESKDSDGDTPLSWATIEGYETVLEILLENGANIESKDSNGLTPLSFAAMHGHEMIMELLLENDSSGLTPLSWAIRNKHERMVELLLKNGATRNQSL